jgi:hypothetical protein
LTGAAASAFGALVAGVEAMQQRLCSQAAVGQPYEALHDDAHRQVAAILREVGLARGSDDELVAKGVTRAFFPHGLGHSLGLQTHDVGCGLLMPAPLAGTAASVLAEATPPRQKVPGAQACGLSGSGAMVALPAKYTHVGARGPETSELRMRRRTPDASGSTVAFSHASRRMAASHASSGT